MNTLYPFSTKACILLALDAVVSQTKLVPLSASSAAVLSARRAAAPRLLYAG